MWTLAPLMLDANAYWQRVNKESWHAHNAALYRRVFWLHRGVGGHWVKPFFGNDQRLNVQQLRAIFWGLWMRLTSRTVSQLTDLENRKSVTIPSFIFVVFTSKNKLRFLLCWKVKTFYMEQNNLAWVGLKTNIFFILLLDLTFITTIFTGLKLKSNG